MKKILCSLIILATMPAYSMNYLNGMKQVYTQLESTHKNDKKFIEKLHEAQVKWEEFIKVQSELMYLNHGGSEAPMCVDAYKFSLDIAIANETKYLLFFEDGDSCTGRS